MQDAIVRLLPGIHVWLYSACMKLTEIDCARRNHVGDCNGCEKFRVFVEVRKQGVREP